MPSVYCLLCLGTGLCSLDVAVYFGHVAIDCSILTRKYKVYVYMGIQAACTCVVATEMDKLVTFYCFLLRKLSFHYPSSLSLPISIYYSSWLAPQVHTKTQLFGQVGV